MSKEVSEEAMKAFVEYQFEVGLVTPRGWYVIVNFDGGASSAITQIPDLATSFAHRAAVTTFEVSFPTFQPNRTN